ncbi:MAG: site-specific integrase [Lactobacillaceae bacterium]|jgi:integrase|nr:site-specific integrase [Lactobacillaceae bacterium]
MGIRKQSDGGYEVRLTFTDNFGRRQEKRKRNITTLTLARKWEHDVIAKIEDGEFEVFSSNMTLNAALEKWLNQYSKKVKPSTYRKAKQFIDKHVLSPEWFDQVKISSITSPMLQGFINYISSINVNYRKNMSPFKQVMKMAVAFKLIKENPFDLVVYPKAKPAPVFINRVDFYNKEQLETFLNMAFTLYANDKFQIYTLFRVLAFTGMRRGEALALTWNDIMFETNEIKIDKALSTDENGKIILSTPKSKAGYRTVKVDTTTLSILKKLQAVQAESLLKHGLSSSGYVFTTDDLQTHASITKPRKWAETIVKRAGLPRIKVHGFRHTYATLAVQAGMNVKQLQYQLGHEDVQTTLSVYASVTQDMKDSTAEIFTSLVNF